MKEFFKSKIFYFILGALIINISVVFAYTYVATDVGFTPTDESWNVKNVSAALNSLRNEHIFEHFSESFLNGSMYGIYESKNLSTWNGTTRDGEYLSLNSNGALYSIPNQNITTGCYFFLVYGTNLSNKMTPDIVNVAVVLLFGPNFGNNQIIMYITTLMPVITLVMVLLEFGVIPIMYLKLRQQLFLKLKHVHIKKIEYLNVFML